MSNHGRFIWYELMTTDRKAAQAFYTGLMGWGARDMPMPGMVYTTFMLGETGVGGLMDLPEDAKAMGMPPSWLGYVLVDDVDAAAAKAKGRGAATHVEPRDIPEIGRFAVIGDPQGAAIALFKPKMESDGPWPAPGTPGRAGWHELLAADWQKAFAFYADMFGWQKADAVDMGPMGTYQLFSRDGQNIGGMFNKPPAVPAPFWLYYFNVDNIDAGIGRVTAGGGEIVNGPMQVPGGSWIAQAKDPQRAMFALVGPRK